MKKESNTQIVLASIFSLIEVLIIIGTRIMRHHLNNASDQIVFCVGVLPNFAAGFYLPYFLLLFFILLQRKSHLSNLSFSLPVAIGMTVSGLFLWEVVQELVWNIPFDFNDIIATLLGVLCATGVYLHVKRFQMNLVENK